MVQAHSIIDVGGVPLAVERSGRGAPIVCLTAIGHDARDFDRLVERLGGSFEFIKVEWPGHGRSGPDTEPASAPRYAELLEGLLLRLGVEAPLLIGNSIGGTVAILYASRRPVRGVVLCDSGGLVELTPLVRRICGALAAFFAAGARGRALWYDALFALYYRQILTGRLAAAQRRRIVSDRYRLAHILHQAWTSFTHPEADLRDVAASLDVPIWVAWAKGDKIIPFNACRPAIARFRRHSITLFPGGHTPFLEAPDAFASGLRAFADTLPTLGLKARAG